jgi:hypothetical protein
MLKPYIIYYRYKIPGEKKPGAQKQFRVYADSLENARRMALAQANYPNIEVLKVAPGRAR